jgi:cobalt-zinc-cadmium efflux system outer membrane protein
MKIHVTAWGSQFLAFAFAVQIFSHVRVSAQEAGSVTKPSEAAALRDLLTEAEQNNAAIHAATYGYRAARNVPKSAGALPDTHVQVQSFSVGSPKPFAGYTNSDFAYIGVGVSQDIPYPGKRRLRSEAAQEEAEAQGADVESARRHVLQQLKTNYFRLSYLQQTQEVLRRDKQVLNVIEQVAEARYRTGSGSQQEVLKAQLQKTKLLQEVITNQQDEGRLQAELKQLLNRPQSSARIVAEPLSRRNLILSSTELHDLALRQNPEVRFQQEMIKSAGSQVRLAQKEFRPDFNVQYMYQNTGPDYRDYYMLTFGINLPNRGRRRAELGEAEEKRQQARQVLQDRVQRQSAELEQAFVVAQTAGEQLDTYRQGLLPQAEATFRSALASYQANRQDFQTLLSAFLDVLNVEIDYQRQLSEHESALAQIEAITGVTVP